MRGCRPGRGCSAPWKDRWGTSVCKDREKWIQRGTDGGEIGDSSGGRGKQISITQLEHVGWEV